MIINSHLMIHQSLMISTIKMLMRAFLLLFRRLEEELTAGGKGKTNWIALTLPYWNHYKALSSIPLNRTSKGHQIKGRQKNSLIKFLIVMTVMTVMMNLSQLVWICGEQINKTRLIRQMRPTLQSLLMAMMAMSTTTLRQEFLAMVRAKHLRTKRAQKRPKQRIQISRKSKIQL